MGRAVMASRARTNAGSASNPCSTSCTTGRQVTTSSKSTSRSRSRRGGFRNTSTQTDVSTSTTAALPVDSFVLPHDRQVTLPEARAGQIEDLTRLDPPDHLSQCAFDSLRVRALATQSGGLLQQVTIKHKICTFHAHNGNTTAGSGSSWAEKKGPPV